MTGLSRLACCWLFCFMAGSSVAQSMKWCDKIFHQLKILSPNFIVFSIDWNIFHELWIQLFFLVCNYNGLWLIHSLARSRVTMSMTWPMTCAALRPSAFLHLNPIPTLTNSLIHTTYHNPTFRPSQTLKLTKYDYMKSFSSTCCALVTWPLLVMNDFWP